MRYGIALFFQNESDWNRHDALKRGETVGPMAIEDGQVWREQLALAELVEPLAFDSLWTFEHHSAPYQLHPNPMQELAFFAGRTRRIDVGTMVTVLPWHHPIRLAEQISVLQHQLGPNRRLILGVGRGLARREFNLMGIDMEESRGRFNEVLEILRLAFTQEMFSYEGEYFRYKNATLRPRPLDPSVVQDAYAVWTSELSKQNVAKLGLHPLTPPTHTMEQFKRDLEDFDAIRAENGHGPAKPPILQIAFYCSESEQEAQEDVERHVAEYVDSVMRHYELGGAHLETTKGYESYRASGGHSAFGSGERSDAYAKLTSLFLDNAILGTPEACLEKIVAFRELMHPSEMVFIPTIGTLSAAKSERSMRLLAEKVLPRLADTRRPVAAA